MKDFSSKFTLPGQVKYYKYNYRVCRKRCVSALETIEQQYLNAIIGIDTLRTKIIIEDVFDLQVDYKRQERQLSYIAELRLCANKFTIETKDIVIGCMEWSHSKDVEDSKQTALKEVERYFIERIKSITIH